MSGIIRTYRIANITNAHEALKNSWEYAEPFTTTIIWLQSGWKLSV